MKKLELLAKIQNLPFPPQILGLLHGMALVNEAVKSMGTAWGLGALNNGIEADEVNRIVRHTLRHVAETNVLALRYALNDLKVPDTLRTMYMGYLIQCCVDMDEEEVASIFEKVGVLTDLLSTQRMARVDVPDKQDIITKPH